MVFDDDVNEVEEVFVVLLELVRAENPDKVDLSQRKASLCRIMDDDCECLAFGKYTLCIVGILVFLSLFLLLSLCCNFHSVLSFSSSFPACPFRY